MKIHTKHSSFKKKSFDEFLGSSHQFDQSTRNNFIGVIALPIRPGVVWFFVIGFVLFICAVCLRIGILTITDGERYLLRSHYNYLAADPIFASRGLLLDRRGVPLAWNEKSPNVEYLLRKTIRAPGLGTVLGAVRYPQRDTKGYYWQVETIGVGGLEKYFDSTLSGVSGFRYYVERENGLGKGDTRELAPQSGSSVTTTLDARMVTALGSALQEYVDTYGFRAAAGIITDIQTGEVRAMASVPDVDPEIISSGDVEQLSRYQNDSASPYLNRVIDAELSPGSTVKPYIAIGALDAGIITPETTIYSSGELVVVNPYDPAKPTVFHDWKDGGHGTTNVRKALAESVNTFFYEIGGGYGSQKGLGIEKLRSYVGMFGFGSPAELIPLGSSQDGNIPSPVWKRRLFGEGWRLGDTYNTAIGQYGFTVAPIQQVRAVSAIATNGVLRELTLIPGKYGQVRVVNGDIKESDYSVIRSGMRDVVTVGTGAWSMNVPYIDIAAKTGTAQVGDKKHVHSWVVGFWPYENPKYAFALMGEFGPATGSPNVSWVMRKVLDELHITAPEVFISGDPTDIEPVPVGD